MKKGILHTLAYYGICGLIFGTLTVFLEEPRHAPGLNYIFLILLLMGCAGLIFMSLMNILMKKDSAYNTGAILIHLCFGIGLVATYLIGYYRQFQ